MSSKESSPLSSLSPEPTKEVPNDAKEDGEEQADGSDEGSKAPNVSPDAESSEAAGSSSPPENASRDDNGEDALAQAAAASSSSMMQGDWQAIWSPQHNAYYFFNGRTKETTWTNPLADGQQGAGPSSGFGSGGARFDAQAAAAAQGIDPALAYLDPSLSAGPSNPAVYTYAAKFNARTGAFTRPDGRDPNHVSEFERMKRMSEFYFDYNSWQQDLEKEHEEEAEAGEKRKKKPTKADLEMYKERKKQKKIAKTAWLRT